MKKVKMVHSVRYSIIIWMLVTLVLVCSCQKNKSTFDINKPPQEFSISKTDSSVFILNLIKDKFYNVTIDQKGIDVVVYLENDSNEIVKEKDSPNGKNGEEQFYFYCENEGEYQLKVIPFNDGENPEEGKYTIAISEQDTQTKIDLEASKYEEDFKTFKTIFEKANSGLYRYHSKKEVDSVFLVNQNKINDKTSYLEFYNLIWNVIDYTGSCHNNLGLPQYLKTLIFRKDIFFPIPLKYIEGKLYSNIQEKDIPAGAEIISVNGIASREFVDQILAYRSTDGVNQTAKYNFIQTNWAPLYIYYAYGENDKYTIQYKFNDQIKSIILKGVNFKTYLQNFEKRYSSAYEEQRKEDYHYHDIDSIAAGYMSVKTFDVGEKGDEAYVRYTSFLDSVFTSLQNKKNLIVDIRGNGGGTGDALMVLTTYLSNRSVKENIGAYTLFNKVPYPELYKGSIPNTEDFLSEYVTEFKEGKYYQNPKFNPHWQPNENSFQGNIILLIDPFVASAASHFAAHIKSDQRAIVIGEETGGAYYGHTGHFPVEYELPNSQLLLSFSIVNLEQDVAPLADEKFGNGVIPDIEITQNHKDFLQHRDTQLNFALEYVYKNKQN